MKTIFKIPGMHCKSCATLITEVSQEFPALNSVDVNLDTKMVTLDHEESLDLSAWKKEIESLGADYTVLNA